MEHTTDTATESSDSVHIQRIHEQVCRVKASEEMGAKYLQAWEEKYYEREEGMEEGIKKGRIESQTELIQKKLSKGKSLEEIADALEMTIDEVSVFIQEMELQ